MKLQNIKCIIDIPYNPIVNISKNMDIICIQDIYDGHNPVIEYEVTIEDSTTLRSIININKSLDSNNETCQTLNDVISPLCGPSFNINVRSRNKVGLSLPTSKILSKFGNMSPTLVMSIRFL